MYASGSHLERYEALVCAAVIAAHVNTGEEFRQRDVRFLIELFSNWIEHSIGHTCLPLKNTQIARYLESLTKNKLCKTRKTSPPVYCLNSVGVIDLLSRIANIEATAQYDQIFFSIYFIKNYKSRLWNLIEQESKKYPFGTKLEIESLLDESQLIDRLISSIEIDIKKLERRIADAIKSTESVRSQVNQGFSHEEIIDNVSKHHPYELSSQKTLSELLQGLSYDHAAWELSHGSLARAGDLWTPSLEMKKQLYTLLCELKEEA